ncbi:MAG TPA: DNA-3-methyladenine glycosylase 2 family protein, partial [Chitinophagaceae bacterium]
MSRKDTDLKKVIAEYGYPPLWVRPNSYETLVLTILEQQVSLASAYAAYKKLKERLGEIAPVKLLNLSDGELRACYLSRQKIIYTRLLAEAIMAGNIDLPSFQDKPDEQVRTELKKIKGIGDWTVDIYLIHALQRTDIFPIGDLALINAIKMVKGIKEISKEELTSMSKSWKPLRSMATMLFWHYYIKKKNI